MDHICRQKAYSANNKVIITEYDRKARLLHPLKIGQQVLVQRENGKWKDQGIIAEVLPFRQYRIRMLGSGRVTLRNRRFIKVCESLPSTLNPNDEKLISEVQKPSTNEEETFQQMPIDKQLVPDIQKPQRQENVPTNPVPRPSNMLKRLGDFNNKGLKE